MDMLLNTATLNNMQCSFTPYAIQKQKHKSEIQPLR